MSIELLMPSSHLILYCPLLLRPWVFPSIRVRINRTALLRPYQIGNHGPDEETRAKPVRDPAWIMLSIRADRVSDSFTQGPFWFPFPRQEQWLRAVACCRLLCSPLSLDWIRAGQDHLGGAWVFLSDHYDEQRLSHLTVITFLWALWGQEPCLLGLAVYIPRTRHILNQ